MSLLFGAKKILQQSANTGKLMMQQFEHLIVIDFEATCDRKHAPKPQEIIEFPAITLRTADCFVGSEFHQYVKPKYHPQLTTFCTELTGIIQSTVDSASPFETVLEDFAKWLNNQNISSFAFVTCGDWDLGKQLPSQCRFYNINIPTCFNRWINVKKIFAEHTGTWPRGMTDMLSLLNLPLVGRHHSGIDDCRNITTVVKELLKQGATFTITSTSNSGPPIDS